MRSRPTTTTRMPFCRVSALFVACWRQTLTRKNDVSPSLQVSPSRTRGVTASRKLATATPLDVNFSSGSAVRLPTSTTWLSLATCTPHSHPAPRSEEHTSELQSRPHLVCRLLLE